MATYRSPTKAESLYFQHLEKLVESHGKAEEKQLLGRWRQELRSFFAGANSTLLSGRQHLEFGIQSDLALKINLKSPGLATGVSSLDIFADDPVLAPWASLILARGLRFHGGIKLTPERLSHELYLYLDQPGDEAAAVSLAPSLQPLLDRYQPVGIGVDNHRGLSVYFTAPDTSMQTLVARETGITPEQLHCIWCYQQARQEQGQVIAGKSALELKPFTPALLTRLISRYPFPWFRYLFRGASLRSANFGGDHVSRQFSLYADVT
ncbi:MAG: hypothetical protein LPK06_04000 [Marinobacter sp.]|nr:hypothetical protein [Marinobacter sp.]